MNHFSAVITDSTIVLAKVDDRMSFGVVAEAPRPASLADADMTLAAFGYRRTEAWDLCGAGLTARIIQV